MPSVLIASDKFKGSLTAAEVADAVGDGVRRVLPHARVCCTPVADGGDGTLTAALAAGFTEVPVTASGPTGQPARTRYARRGTTAVVELADVCGLSRLPDTRREPMRATSRGVGEVVAAALAAGCRDIVLGVGGSASTDGGAGLVTALGARLLDSRGRPVGSGGEALSEVTTVDLTGLHATLRGASVTIASDVDNPLTGPAGAAAVYGPQKGADPAQVAVLDTALTRWADVVAHATGRDLRDVPGAGAAGGVGFAGLAVLDAALRPGIELVLDLVGFRRHLPGADLVVTGEGALDEQTLRGKAPVGVARAAAAAGVPVVAVCGTNNLPAQRLRVAGIRTAYALAELAPDLAACFRNAPPLLRALGERIAAEHLTQISEKGTDR
ncbi:glycerate kinase [Saccharomonospora cyanea]|uniref:Glycerate kinase n=1 Tax=Saccharomonospora cyanea NA-134 TaxID=882082 RepID=H5XF63_9PSEU|nr:glycerate kinase [Saccharomonospora cyanea]EHR61473.1 glycerate kinase [Saccharomonospora cyanea NA-134]